MRNNGEKIKCDNNLWRGKIKHLTRLFLLIEIFVRSLITLFIKYLRENGCQDLYLLLKEKIIIFSVFIKA